MRFILLMVLVCCRTEGLISPDGGCEGEGSEEGECLRRLQNRARLGAARQTNRGMTHAGCFTLKFGMVLEPAVVQKFSDSCCTCQLALAYRQKLCLSLCITQCCSACSFMLSTRLGFFLLSSSNGEPTWLWSSKCGTTIHTELPS